MIEQPLGKLMRLKLCEVWLNKASGFTPWIFRQRVAELDVSNLVEVDEA